MKYIFVLALGVSTMAQAQTVPPLHVEDSRFVDPAGHTVILRGEASMGMGMVYGDKANPGTYVAMTPAQYVDRAIQTDSTGQPWLSRAIRLNFERFSVVEPRTVVFG